MSPSDVIGLIVAALGGTAVGLERQRSGHAEGPSARFAGIRTFTMLGALAGVAGWLWMTGGAALAAILLTGAVAITVSAYIVASRQNVDGTTEVSALIVMAAGVLAGMGSLRLASGIIAVEVLLLVEKSRLHALAERIDDVDLRSAVRFGVMALVILPLLPEGPFGPLGGVRPRALWAFVLFFSGLSFIGHVMRRVVGPERGYLASGLIGGLVSSTNVTLTFARSSRNQRPLERALAFGAVAANAVLYPRVLVAIAVLNPALVLPVLPYLAAPALIVAAVAAAGLRTQDGGVDASSNLPSRNPLQVSAAVQMAILFQGVLTIVGIARARWGDAGTVATAAVLGLTDVDALTLSMAREVAPKAGLDTAALAIATGVVANTFVKMTLALIFGGPRFRTIAGGALAAVMIAALLSIALRTW
jgi:uncharacterized membrane protein (DUF4010 family)